MNYQYLGVAIMQMNKDAVSEDNNIDTEIDNIIGRPSPSYHLEEYWEKRYQTDVNSYEWYQDPDDLIPVIKSEFKTKEKALDVGCGSSTLPIGLIDIGFEKVIGLDISKTVIEQNKKRYENIRNLEFVVGDVTKMQFEDKSFDIVIDKGTMDSLLSSLVIHKKANLMLEEIIRVLKPNGVFIEISYGTPGTRTPLFEKLKEFWNIDSPKTIIKPNDKKSSHYIYIAQKKGEKR
ncbi:Menaquinone biosynthesis methyltransferase [Tritrichomonas foetus]|uniref:Menaquinone biosynthesis methyltransferase n=1 Tax=Tritrichomonas foetus TaxID=1144522 RepID=A0A1J4K0U8_9EUKA|nr:Menaquinone biosynthesis methyltransferase [Tritrichomonas foetus]|eukprot:OHT04999.1 Menaquinone biosynthesis methyltransferase [Tritrichomonas foetus]